MYFLILLIKCICCGLSLCKISAILKDKEDLECPTSSFRHYFQLLCDLGNYFAEVSHSWASLTAHLPQKHRAVLGLKWGLLNTLWALFHHTAFGQAHLDFWADLQLMVWWAQADVVAAGVGISERDTQRQHDCHAARFEEDGVVCCHGQHVRRATARWISCESDLVETYKNAQRPHIGDDLKCLPKVQFLWFLIGLQSKFCQCWMFPNQPVTTPPHLLSFYDVCAADSTHSLQG